MKWIELKTGLEGEHQLGELIEEGIPFLGYSKEWESGDTPMGIRECYFDEFDGIISAKWMRIRIADDGTGIYGWEQIPYSQPTHLCLYQKP